MKIDNLSIRLGAYSLRVRYKEYKGFLVEQDKLYKPPWSK